MFKTLKSRISLVYICLVLLIALIGAASVTNLYRLERSVEGLMTNNYKSINAAANMLEAIERQDSAVLIYMNGDRQKGITLFSENNNVFSKWYYVEFNNITVPGEKELVDNIDSYYNTYIRLFSELQEIRNVKGEMETNKFYSSSVMPQFIKVKNELKSLSFLNEKAMFRSKDSASNNTKRSMYTVLLLSFGAVIGGFFVSRYFINRFLSPIHHLAEGIRHVRAGDLNQRIELNIKDETGELAMEFNNMTERLLQYEQSTLGTLMTEKNKSIAIVKSIADPLFVLDTNYRVTLINNACENFFDINEEKILNKHFLEAVRNGELFDHISSVAEIENEHREKIIHIKRDKSFYFNVIVTPVKAFGESISGLIVLMQDVSKLKELERVKTDFIATISHEFKTPLTSIMMGASLLQEESLGKLNNEQKDIVGTINEDGERLSSLVNELLELSRIESGRAVYNMVLCSINAIVENSIKRFFEAANRKEISLINELEENLPYVNADFEKMTWVINNLIGNALKYTNAGDYITVNASVKVNKMYISVKDTGMGIPDDFKEKVFDRFVQVKGHDIEVRGTGLGLSVVKEIIAAHNGEIWCESELDSGSTFTFTLPIYKREGLI